MGNDAMRAVSSLELRLKEQLVGTRAKGGRKRLEDGGGKASRRDGQWDGRGKRGLERKEQA